MNGNVLDMSLETEEFITAEEYMKRRKAGAIDPARVRYAVNPPNGQIGGFYVKLERPRYRVAIPSVKRRIKMPDEELPAVPGNEVLLQQDQHQYEIAKLNIEKTCENNAMWAEHWYKMRLAAYVFAGVGLLLVFTFCAIALFIGKDAIAMEIIKAGIFIVAGGGAGYAIGYRRGQNSGTE